MLVTLSSLSPEVVALLTRAHGPGVDDASIRALYEVGSASLRGWVEEGRLVGAIAYVVMEDGAVRILAIASDPSSERSGVGRLLLSAVQAETTASRLEAETDDDAVGFYVACGFSVTRLGEKYPRVNRYLVHR